MDIHVECKVARLTANIDALHNLGISVEVQDKNVLKVITIRRGAVVMYYPGTNKWQYRGKVMTGTPVSLKIWLVEKGLL